MYQWCTNCCWFAAQVSCLDQSPCALGAIGHSPLLSGEMSSMLKDTASVLSEGASMGPGATPPGGAVVPQGSPGRGLHVLQPGLNRWERPRLQKWPNLMSV